MVSSYLICDACGRFGPPAGFLNENGLRLCYQCWFEEWKERQADSQRPVTNPDPTSTPSTDANHDRKKA